MVLGILMVELLGILMVGVATGYAGGGGGTGYPYSGAPGYPCGGVPRHPLGHCSLGRVWSLPLTSLSSGSTT